MSTTPQMSQQHQQQQYGQQLGQQGPSTSPPQNIGQHQGFAQQGYGQQQTIPPQVQQQLQQLGQQQPYQQLLQQMGGRQAQQQPLVLPSAVESLALVSGIATKFWDVVTPLPGQPSILYLFVDGNWRQLVNPNQITHDEVQEAFAFGQQVIAFYDSANSTIQAVIVNKQ
ncbi:hypothetical protein [Streptomyces sp. NPDC059928]|uniref:hypothetical protein n=1 Tax=unclassified Streptomyces TaxID=2593676 RepID=UPI0036592BE3